jgi:CRP-like cAMP-binding protein
MARREMDALAASPLFADLSQRDLRRIARVTEVYAYEDGTEIVTEGTPSAAGDFFGEIGLLDGGPRTATVSADGPLSALVLLRSEFRGLLTSEPPVAYRILRGTARRLRSLEAPASR